MSDSTNVPDLVEFWENEVRPRLRAEEIYASVALSQREGRYRRGKCPLHGGEDNNFSVDTQTLRWTCFSHCGSGSVLAFLNHGQEPRGAQWVESVRQLATNVGLDLPQREYSQAQMQRIQAKERREALLETFRRLAHDTLHTDEGRDAREYLTTQRGFAPADLDIFGACPAPKIATRELNAAGFSAAEIESSGVLRDGRWPLRVLATWRDARGDIGTFVARDTAEGGASDGKYLYLSTEHGWGRKKSDLLLFGLDTALPAARRAGFLLIVEGIFDVLLLQARGFANVAAIGGAGGELSAARLEKLAALGISHVTLLLDNDRQPDGRWPGLEGTVAVVSNSRNSINVPVIDVVHPKKLGDFKDPDSLVRARGLETLHEILAMRRPSVLFEAQLKLDGVTPRSSEIERRRAVDEILEIDRALQGPRQALDREDLLQMTARFTGYSFEALAQLSEDFQIRRDRQTLEKRVDAALREAQKQRAAQQAPLRVLAELNDEVAALGALTLEKPLTFSVERLERESGVVPAGKKSGWKSLDDLDVHFNAGELAIIAGRTGHGKTSVLVSLLLNWLRPLADAPGNEVVVLYSCEEPELRIYHRLLALLTAGTPGGGWTVSQVRDFLRSAYARGSEYSWPDPTALNRARDFLRAIEARLLVVYRPAWTVEDIESHARALHKTRPIGAALVDYLQRVPPPAGGRFDRRDQEVSAIGRRLKSLSVDIAAPIVCGAQINREAIPDGYARSLSNATYDAAKDIIRKARPELHHLREGGSEQEADLILGMLNYAADFRGAQRLPASTLLEIGTLKNRYGEAGKWTQLAFEGRYGNVREPNAGDAL